MVRNFAVAANGIEFRGIEVGSGPLVLCLHGFPDDAGSFEPLALRLADAGYRVVAPNMRGYWPTSAAPDGCYQSWATGTDAVGIVDALGADYALLVGHDWGAVAAYAAVRLAPGRFNKLVAMAVPYGSAFSRALVTDPTQQRRSWYMFLFQTAIAEIALGYDDFALIDRLWADWSPGFQLPDGRRRSLKTMLSQPGVPAALLAYYRQAFAAPGSFPDWEARAAALPEHVTAPTLYLHGCDDDCIGADLATGSTEGFGGGVRVELVPDAGHFLHVEQPVAVADRILTFLRTG